MIIIIKYKCDNYFKKLNINRDLYIKIMREKIISSCNLIVKNVTHLKKSIVYFIYIYFYIYIISKNRKKTTSLYKTYFI